MKRLLAFLLLASCLLSLFSCAQNDPVQPDASEEIFAEAPVETPLPEIPQVEEPVCARVSFFATGDNLIHTGLWRQANRNAGGSGDGCLMSSAYDFRPFYASISEMIQSADLAFLNQETLVAANEEGAPKNYPSFNTPRACGDAMVELGFDVVNVANNHMLDMQSSGLKNSIEYWREKEGVVQVGAYLDESDFESIRVVEKNGIRIAFLAYAEDPNNSGQGTRVPLSNYQPYSSLGLYVPALNEVVLRRQVEAAREISDFVVVAMHWGTENTTTLSPVQTHYAEVCAQIGVDLVLGSHPHVVQTMEYKESPASSTGKTLVVYSLGNMISLMETTEANLLGGALQLDFVKTGEVCTLENVVFVPIVTHCSASYRDIRIELLKDYTAEDYSQHYIHSHCQTDISDFSQIIAGQIPQEFWGDAVYETQN